MAVDILLARDGGKLSAVDTLSAEAIAALDSKRQYVATIRQPRNLKFHRKFFALMQLVYSNQSTYGTLEHMVDAIKVAVGHFDLSHTLEGKAYPIVRSISFASMDNQSFTEFYDRAVQAILTHILPNIGRERLEAQVMDILGNNGGRK